MRRSVSTAALLALVCCGDDSGDSGGGSEACPFGWWTEGVGFDCADKSICNDRPEQGACPFEDCQSHWVIGLQDADEYVSFFATWSAAERAFDPTADPPDLGTFELDIETGTVTTTVNGTWSYACTSSGLAVDDDPSPLVRLPRAIDAELDEQLETGEWRSFVY